MIQSLQIQNFKSIRNLNLNPKRVNLFIGKPATGKSNIIEALATISNRSKSFSDVIRNENLSDIFFAHNLEEKITIKADSIESKIFFLNGEYRQSIKDETNVNFNEKDIDYLNSIQTNYPLPIYFYKFPSRIQFNDVSTERLLSPFGENLPMVILTRGSLKKQVSEILLDYNLRLGLKQNENKIEIIKDEDGVLYTFPFVTASDSLQRIIFYAAILNTSKDAILLFEEPESHIFPYYNKFLGEKIGMDESNQYFIATHNPYFLLSVLEKTKREDINIYITYYEDFETKVKAIPEDKFPEVFDFSSSIFFNLDRILEEI